MHDRIADLRLVRHPERDAGRPRGEHRGSNGFSALLRGVNCWRGVLLTRAGKRDERQRDRRDRNDYPATRTKFRIPHADQCPSPEAPSVQRASRLGRLARPMQGLDSSNRYRNRYRRRGGGRRSRTRPTMGSTPLLHRSDSGSSLRPLQSSNDPCRRGSSGSLHKREAK